MNRPRSVITCGVSEIDGLMDPMQSTSRNSLGDRLVGKAQPLQLVARH